MSTYDICDKVMLARDVFMEKYGQEPTNLFVSSDTLDEWEHVIKRDPNLTTVKTEAKGNSILGLNLFRVVEKNVIKCG